VHTGHPHIRLSQVSQVVEGKAVFDSTQRAVAYDASGSFVSAEHTCSFAFTPIPRDAGGSERSGREGGGVTLFGGEAAGVRDIVMDSGHFLTSPLLAAQVDSGQGGARGGSPALDAPQQVSVFVLSLLALPVHKYKY
jgi:hypothetical protein